MSAGMVRYYNNAFEVYDGMTWIQVPNQYASVGLSSSADIAIDWAMKKMQEERELQQLIDNHIGLRDAYEKFKIMEVLTRSDKDNNEWTR